ncbi:hypothetical protein O181_095101 [Austropuccinia psidii MF-1]|uniref:Integrase catalytic domain-containing protein n=1 Tax=Austropuccinia psidii MF-1 TaxID=1389203 RepID=A0A9Q3J4G8_9BASI|nr:hypothetical protein [Austropuccinia psidii MF-1]
MTIIYKECTSHANEYGLRRWPLDNVKSNPAHEAEVEAKIPIHQIEIYRRKNFRFHEWEPGNACHPQTDHLAERMIQRMEDIIRRFCAYGMEYKDHEGYTKDWVTLLPACQLAYNTGQSSTTGKSPSLVEELWSPLLPVDHLKRNLLTIHPTAKPEGR